MINYKKKLFLIKSIFYARILLKNFPKIIPSKFAIIKLTSLSLPNDQPPEKFPRRLYVHLQFLIKPARPADICLSSSLSRPSARKRTHTKRRAKKAVLRTAATHAALHTVINSPLGNPIYPGIQPIDAIDYSILRPRARARRKGPVMRERYIDTNVYTYLYIYARIHALESQDRPRPFSFSASGRIRARRRPLSRPFGNALYRGEVSK